MKVKAIAKGYYGGQIRNIGDEFVVPDALSAGWFVPVAPDGLNPLEPDNHGLGGELGGDGLNPNGEGLNPEPVWVEPTPAEATPETPAEATPETDNKPRKPNKQENLK